MPHLTVLYVRGHTLGSVLLRNADRWGRWSHCALLSHNGTVIESTVPGGVREVPYIDFLSRHSRVEAVKVSCLRPDRGMAFAQEQIGKPYDWRAVLGNLVRESWERPDAWHCAELVEAALVKAGRRRFRGNSGWRISPNQSFMVT